MAFKELGSSSRDEVLPWANEYLESSPTEVSKIYDVDYIYFSDKGYVVATKVCRAFLFKSAEAYKHIKEFVELWHSSKQASPILQVKLTRSKPHIAIGYEEDRKGNWSITDKYFHQSYNSGMDNPESTKPTNPLPLPSSPTVGVLPPAHEDASRDTAAEQASKQHRSAGAARRLKVAEDKNVPEAG